jgi:hypothetical protein
MKLPREVFGPDFAEISYVGSLFRVRPHTRLDSPRPPFDSSLFFPKAVRESAIHLLHRSAARPLPSLTQTRPTSSGCPQTVYFPSHNMADGIPLDPWKQVALTREQAVEYLERIQLPSSTVSEPPSLELLSKLLQSQLENVPKDTTPMHVSESQWTSQDEHEPIKLTSALTNMPEGTIAFDRIVKQHKGAFCFAVNPTFSAFLRVFGFRVSELVGRTFKNLNNDPLTHPDGWKWGTFTHGFEVVDWPGSEKRYLVDAAWGPWACPVP